MIPDWSESAFQYYFNNATTAVPVRYDDTRHDFRETEAGYDKIYVVVSKMAPQNSRKYLLNEFRKSTTKRLRTEKRFKNINIYVYTNASTATDRSDP